MRLLPECGGQSRVVDRYLEGAPELIAEVSASSASYDLHDKLNAYRRNGVREYVVWRVWDQAIDWFVLRGGSFDHLVPTSEKICQSEVFPGLWLDTAAVLRDDAARVLAVLQQGLASDKHREFVARLNKAKSESP